MSDPVAALLSDSLSAHNESKIARANRERERGRALLVRAAMLRVEALDLDPDRLSPAWRDEQSRTRTGDDTHEALMAFYRKQGVI